jgi:nitroreductase
MDLNEAMRCAPTSRLFTDQPVDVEALKRVFENARFAPSGGNRQGWRVIVVRDAERRRALRDLYVPRWNAYQQQSGRAELLRNPPDGIEPARLRMAQRADHYARHLEDVPVHLLVAVQLSDLLVTDAELPRQSVVGGASVYPFVQNVLLGLRAEGLGAALTTLLVPSETEVKRLLEIPDDFALVAHVGVGHRADPWPKRLSRKPVEEFAFGERFGEPLV